MNTLTAVPPPYPLSFAELFSECHEYGFRIRGLKPNTLAEEIRYAKRFIKLTGTVFPRELFSQISLQFVQEIVFKYKSMHTFGSCRTFQCYLRMFLKFCNFKEYTLCDFSKAVPSVHKPKLSGIPRAVPIECISTLLENIDTKTIIGKRDNAIIQLLVIYGIRSIQLRKLCIKHIDWANSKIIFPAVKRGRKVIQHLTSDAGNVLLEYIMNGRPDTDITEVFLTVRPPYKAITSSTYMSAIINKYLKLGGISLPEGVSHGTHGFRHAFASRMVGKVPINQIAEMLGHRNPSSSLIYSKINFDALKETAQPWPEVKQ